VTAEPVTVRQARPSDLHQIVELIHEHIAYERARPADSGLGPRLASALFRDGPRRLHCYVADSPSGLVGYLTCSAEFSTWDAGEFLHMDCLFVREGSRGAGLGRALIDAARDLAVALGLSSLQWQTPDWNTDAIRFYDRLGASRRPKQRFTMSTSSAARPG
jgi:GNAT superfamily N-acetyltransferase